MTLPVDIEPPLDMLFALTGAFRQPVSLRSDAAGLPRRPARPGRETSSPSRIRCFVTLRVTRDWRS